MQLDCWPVQVVPSITQSEQIDPNIDSIDIILFPPPPIFFKQNSVAYILNLESRKSVLSILGLIPPPLLLYPTVNLIG